MIIFLKIFPKSTSNSLAVSGYTLWVLFLVEIMFFMCLTPVLAVFLTSKYIKIL